MATREDRESLLKRFSGVSQLPQQRNSPPETTYQQQIIVNNYDHNSEDDLPEKSFVFKNDENYGNNYDQSPYYDENNNHDYQNSPSHFSREEDAVVMDQTLSTPSMIPSHVRDPEIEKRVMEILMIDKSAVSRYRMMDLREIIRRHEKGEQSAWILEDTSVLENICTTLISIKKAIHEFAVKCQKISNLGIMTDDEHHIMCKSYFETQKELYVSELRKLCNLYQTREIEKDELLESGFLTATALEKIQMNQQTLRNNILTIEKRPEEFLKRIQENKRDKENAS